VTRKLHLQLLALGQAQMSADIPTRYQEECTERYSTVRLTLSLCNALEELEQAAVAAQLTVNATALNLIGKCKDVVATVCCRAPALSIMLTLEMQCLHPTNRPWGMIFHEALHAVLPLAEQAVKAATRDIYMCASQSNVKAL
jgi:hypothetical protein